MVILGERKKKKGPVKKTFYCMMHSCDNYLHSLALELAHLRQLS